MSLLSNLAMLALALLAGVTTAYQPGLNARFAEHAGAKVWGGVANFAVGLLAMTIVAATFRAPPPAASRLGEGPWWMWLGGLCGAFFVTLALILVPRIGAATYLTAMIAGQLLASVVIDHFGHMGLPIREVTPGRVIGLLLIFGGMVMVRFA